MTTTNRSIVAGVFSNEKNAQQAMSDLQNAGFTNDQIRYSVHQGGSGILDSLQNLGFGQDEANYYNNEFMAGRTVVTVNSQDRRDEAYDILMRNGAYDMNSAGNQTGNYANTTQTDTNATVGQKVQLREEQLQATKERVQAGEVNIRKNVVSEEQTVNVPVNREEVYVERRPVDTAVPSDTPIGQGEEVTRIPVSEEQVQVSKQPIVTEEIIIERYPAPNQMAGTGTTHTGESIQDGSGNEGTIVPLAVGEAMTIFLREEQVHIEKVPVFVEQVTLTKRVIQEMRPIHEMVRKEQVHIEPLGNVTVHDDREGNTSDT
ncbi:MAG TPA: YsnF/AvaK domain-containing protein [Ktedonobacteraceae bacterium]|nr:YsnF/AvaK domain-containing protein [Ktedonobacteraceae bacterium]